MSGNGMIQVLYPPGELTSLSPHGQVFVLLDVQHQLQAVAHPTLHGHQEGASVLARVKGVAFSVTCEYLWTHKEKHGYRDFSDNRERINCQPHSRNQPRVFNPDPGDVVPRRGPLREHLPSPSCYAVSNRPRGHSAEACDKLNPCRYSARM